MSRSTEDIIQGKTYNRIAVTKSIVRRMKRSRSEVVVEGTGAPPGTANIGEIEVNPWDESGVAYLGENVAGPDF